MVVLFDGRGGAPAMVEMLGGCGCGNILQRRCLIAAKVFNDSGHV